MAKAKNKAFDDLFEGLVAKEGEHILYRLNKIRNEYIGFTEQAGRF